MEKETTQGVQSPQTFKLKDFDIDKNPAFFYRSQERRFSLNASMAAFACKIFEGAYKVKHYDQFKELCEAVWADKAKDEDMLPFLEEHILDQIRIITCFENMFKGFLLEKGFLIHVVSNESDFLELHREQKKRPLVYTEIINEQNFYVKDGYPHFKGLTRRTINFSTMLDKEEYRKQLEVDGRFLDLLRTINDDRNNLHMLMKADFTFSTELNNITLFRKLVASVKEQMELHDKSHTEFKVFSLKDGININSK
jgi:hypothetical protein